MRLSFTRSGYDFADEDSLPITGYGAYRRIDDIQVREQVVGCATVSGIENGPLASFESSRMRRCGDRFFVLSGNAGGVRTRSELPR